MCHYQRASTLTLPGLWGPYIAPCSCSLFIFNHHTQLGLSSLLLRIHKLIVLPNWLSMCHSCRNRLHPFQLCQEDLWHHGVHHGGTEARREQTQHEEFQIHHEEELHAFHDQKLDRFFWGHLRGNNGLQNANISYVTLLFSIYLHMMHCIIMYWHSLFLL